MKKKDLQFAVSTLLLFSLPITAILGFIQSQLELRKFVPHRYFAYLTVCLAAIHLFLNWKRYRRYFRRAEKVTEK